MENSFNWKYAGQRMKLKIKKGSLKCALICLFVFYATEDTEVKQTRLTLTSPSRYVRATNFSTSSMRMTGKESFSTIIHCSVFRWVSLKIICGRKSCPALPLLDPERMLCCGSRETHRQGVHVDDHEVKGHGKGHGTHQPAVTPWRHAQQRLVLRQAGGR